MNRTALLLARALLAVPDLHRVDPWWRALCEARRVALRRSGVRVGDGVVVHERVHLDRRVTVSLGDRSEVRDRVRDALAAFDYYIRHYNQGRPFVLVGHSQGSAMTKLILFDYLSARPDVYRRMVAA